MTQIGLTRTHRESARDREIASRLVSRRVVYTVLFGGYEGLLEQPAFEGSTIDRICFTDDPELTSPTWEVRCVPRALPADTTRSARTPKILAHDYVGEYDESLYIDNSVLLKRPPEELFAELLPAHTSMALMRHSYRELLSEEFDEVVRLKLDAWWACEEQRAHYEAVDPAVLQSQTLWHGIILRRHGDRVVRRTMELWWLHVMRYSRRDQLSLNFCLRATGLDPLVHAYDNNDSPFHTWPYWRADFARANHVREVDPVTRRMAGIEAENDELKRRLHTEQHARTDLEERSAFLAAKVDEAEHRRSESDGRAAAFEQSLSWRVTAPLRAITRAFRSR
jgi:hypothetical protein